MSRARGSVWWAPAPHKAIGGSYRPWLVLSTDDHPFASEECIVSALTTTNHERGIRLSDGDWVEGGTDVQSFVSPWYVTTVKKSDLDRWQGKLTKSTVTNGIAELHRYVPREP